MYAHNMWYYIFNTIIIYDHGVFYAAKVERANQTMKKKMLFIKLDKQKEARGVEFE